MHLDDGKMNCFKNNVTNKVMIDKAKKVIFVYSVRNLPFNLYKFCLSNNTRFNQKYARIYTSDNNY